MTSLLSVDKLSIAVGETPIIKELSLSVKSGEIHAIMGPNGSGKSTFVSTLMGHPAYTVQGGDATFETDDFGMSSHLWRDQFNSFFAFSKCSSGALGLICSSLLVSNKKM